ncbi:glycine betaine ABC transporter substrate-binding protein [Natranaerobius thermophilus]|uniref:Substrate-binding region of ABC-type glycine betaine transport system n=1 Tax=Natranaerobius thermophilus (strain ATCC BAA-1301 / DSM 18059 / JW/NM-WN-LF) TaxID=457570 RepID=B2A5Y2_NATTJ|nr:glycine betaine ABC transporter substrate-binding protein [Natranaerobius thermophilus]ACB85399.1 Substrate-binding region of ABC-type glycine betaine transport system [Natranaerobius thermophilus JW/NM-WN-LF]
MRKLKLVLVTMITIVLLTACTNGGGGVTAGEESKETIKFGMTDWTSTAVPTEIARQILEEAGYETETTNADQPVIFVGLVDEEIDFFMDAWLPYTEEALWDEHGEDLQKVSASYKEAPLGWVVPEYVEEDTLDEFLANLDKYNNEIVGIDSGAGISEISKEMIEDLGIGDELEFVPSSEAAMMGEAMSAMDNEEPIAFLGWRPHSMFTQYDIKFLEGQEEYFKADNVYVISYEGIEDKHPEAYEILSDWSMPIEDLEEMMYEHEENDVEYEVLAEQWIKENRDKVDEMLGN